ncbi:hypothetical protein SDC9_151460 [bioreactor metagenome]|uniref:Uncharacterized protein n=1 Tax=bioreactor metagenome TaxID=1076179 RepID=A0A645EUQ1_9ZZZZ
MSDSQEKTINGQVNFLFVGLAHALYQMHPFHAIFSEQAYGIVFEKNFNFWIVHYSLLHNLRCPQIRFTYNQIHFTGQSRQVSSFFASGIPTAYNGNCFFTIEKSVAGSTGRNALSGVFCFVGQA